MQLHHQMSQQNQNQQQMWRKNQLQLQMGQPNQLQKRMRQLSHLQSSEQQMAQLSRLQTPGRQDYLLQQQMRQEHLLQLQQLSRQSKLQQQQTGQLGSGDLSQSRLMRQGRHCQMFSGEAEVDSAATFNLQNQFLNSARENAEFIQGSQFNANNSPRQSLPGMRTMGVTGSPNFSNSLGCSQQRMALGQLRQQLSYQNALAAGQAQKITMNDQISGLSQNGQLGMIRNAMPQQQQLLQMSGMASAYSSHQQQMLLKQEPSSTQWLRNTGGLNAEQLSQLLQQKPQMDCSQLQQKQGREETLPQQLPHQQQIHRAVVPGDQRCLNLTGSQPHTSSSGITTSGGSLSQGRKASNQLLGRRRIQDLVAQMGLNGSLDPELERLFLGIADNFIESVTAFSGDLAKHRNSSTLEAKDVLLHLEKNWNLTLPGYSCEEREQNPDPIVNDATSNSDSEKFASQSTVLP